MSQEVVDIVGFTTNLHDSFLAAMKAMPATTGYLLDDTWRHCGGWGVVKGADGGDTQEQAFRYGHWPLFARCRAVRHQVRGYAAMLEGGRTASVNCRNKLSTDAMPLGCQEMAPAPDSQVHGQQRQQSSETRRGDRGD
jgi:hypothetical protein